MRHTLFLVALTVGVTTFLTGCGGEGWNGVVKRARAENKPVLLKFGGPW